MSKPATLTIVRHGETEWSAAHRHTGRTDIPLTAAGRDQARAAAGPLAATTPVLVLSSPLQRALNTGQLAGLGERIETDPDLVEWDYGAYEGLTTEEIHEKAPDWQLFRDGCPQGESTEQVGARADRVVARLRDAGGDALVFSHGHFSRVLAARWLGLPVEVGRCLALSTAAICTLGYEHGVDDPVVLHWNDTGHLPRSGAS